MSPEIIAALIGGSTVVVLAFVKHYRDNPVDAAKPAYAASFLSSSLGTVLGCLLPIILIFGAMIGLTMLGY